MNKKIVIYIIVLIIFVIILKSFNFGMSLFISPTIFAEIDIGENFMHSRDGHCKKIHSNYCLYVDLSSTTCLVQIPNKYVDKDWSFDFFNDNVLLEGHYVKGYHSETSVVLVEERDDNSMVYLSFDFSTTMVKFYRSEDDVLTEFGFEQNQWYPLCNLNEEILSKK